MTKKAKIVGVAQDVELVNFVMPNTLNKKYKLKSYIEVSETRSNNNINTIDLDDEDLVAIEFNDQTEWIGHPADVQAIYDKKTLHQRSTNSNDYVFDTQISNEDSSRGYIKRALVKVFSVFTPSKQVEEIAMTALAESYDNKIQPHSGLYQIDSNFKKSSYKIPKEDTKIPFLLLLHGTISTTLDAFSALNNDNDTWKSIHNIYGNQIIALEHFTLSVSPLQNALDFLKACPNTITIDILSHSRGGLIADILAKCDYRNTVTGFSAQEIEILKGKEEQGNRELMEAITKEAKRKKITINRVIRVAAPSSGTTILSRRMDHYFNLMLNAVSLAFGVTNPLYHTVKAFLLDLVSQKENPEVLPGLNSMMPESLFQKMLNISDTSVVSELYNISGDSEVGGVSFDSLKVILANLFYLEANDLVVDTRRMSHGVIRQDGIYKYLSQGSGTNHFNYFSDKESRLAILQAFQASKEIPAELFTKETYSDANRGILLDRLSMGGISVRPEIITRDVVIFIPGIMGSSLSQNNESQWVNMRELNQGGIPNNLNINAKNVEASGVIIKYYNDFVNHLLEQYDVITLEFDWRKSLTEAAETLKNEIEDITKNHKVKLHIIAHSMGGVMARQCMINHADTWALFKQNQSNKFIMLGTPWLGSYLVMEVLTGHSKRVKQLAALDFKNDRSDLLKVFWKYPGIFELMPIEKESNRHFWDEKFWQALDDQANLKHMPIPTSDPKLLDKDKRHRATDLEMLNSFNDYKKKISSFLDNLTDSDFNNIYYICGQSDKTVFDYELKDRFLSQTKKLVYKATSHGDGSVTWATGIPKQLLNSNNLYYTHTTHADLANEDYIFQGISDILSTGSTNALSSQRPSTRGEEIISEVYESSEPISDANAVINAIFDVKTKIKTETESFNIKIIHGDLKVASYPVMVGHFFMDLILSSEKALDGYLNNRLSQRMSIGYYPGKVGESEVFFNLNTQPRGAVVCGLGSPDTLTSFLLSQSVKQAVLKYAMFMRDNYTLPRAKKYAKGMSFVLMGIGYGRLPIEESINGLLLGIAEANKHIKDTQEGLQCLKDIEIVNYYESIASQAYFSLSRLQNKNDARIAFRLQKGITKRTGAKKRNIFRHNEYERWVNLHIDSVKDDALVCETDDGISGFKYYQSSGLARVEEEMVGIGLHKINHLLKEMSTSSSWDSRLSKSLFEMLVPNDFKNTFRNQNNLVLKLDKHAAQIPWELLHDSKTSDTPTSVTSSFIRQLVTNDSVRFNQVSLNNIEAFVVGDPIYNQNNLPQLPAAKIEAEWVANTLKKSAYQVNSLINSSAKNIMMELFSKHYKIMHFAGHGIYDPENCNVGIAIGNGICIDPAMINQLGYVPEFVFINCCYSGTLNAQDEAYSKNRYRLAANIGTQLIEMGVKAIIISGWAVNDGAAKVFAETFYGKMFQGYDFGSAVKQARLACFQKYPSSNTWGAYQCYGNQFYMFKNRSKSSRFKEEYVVSSQVHTDLDNLFIAIRDKKEDSASAQRKLDKYIDQAQSCNLLDAVTLEKEAMIYDELDMSDVAYLKYQDLFEFDKGNYSIKALEQYCLVLSHRLGKDVKPEDGMTKKQTISAYLNEIKLLTLAGKNPSRLNIIGNAYKLSARHFNTKDKIDKFKMAYNSYQDALIISKDKHNGQYLDALSNMIYIGYFLELLGDDKSLLSRFNENPAFTKVTNLEKHLNEFYEELDDYDKSDLDISVLIGMTEISYALMLINPKNINKQEQNILKWYRQIFHQIYSPRYIKIEILQIEFFIDNIKDSKIKKSLTYIKSELEKY
ncbi:CHAT domain-containing protein [Algibacter miyuki]|uniref:CHAT domain-containing protein n=1 Tax=Algibacter miyuki TaxID=1306933 RepID=A0ABV5H409_9FLAO|nr:CHAT domain-containing protein [Algibacter miyuki]MDN3665678.1 CHAT domain-containing protein [Algibacter miyuki]